MNTVLTAAFHSPLQDRLERSWWYGPNLVSILADGAETSGAFSLLKVRLRRGFDPPLHVHQHEDESSYIIDGEILFTVGDQEYLARAGDFVHLPKGIPHRFQVLSETATTLLYISPAGFEQMFRDCGRPALSLELPTLTGAPDPAFFAKLQEVNERLGVRILPAL